MSGRRRRPAAPDGPRHRGRRGDAPGGRPGARSARLPRRPRPPTAAARSERWEQRRPDLVLLDLGLPDMDGLQVIRRIRREATTPIVILSGRYEEREKVQALERGADDYVTKPFGVDELNARLRVALRHAAGPVGRRRRERSRSARSTLDVARHVVTVGGRTGGAHAAGVRAAAGPADERRAGSSTKGRLLRAVWGEAYQGEDSYVYVHVSQLRRKLAAADARRRAARPDRHRARRRLSRPRRGPVAARL